jgi:DHA1 family multidrug resistance protein-like MFS transporter
MTLLGCVSALLLPSPFIFYVYGKRIRARSKFASTRDFELGEIDEKEEEVVDADGDRRSGAI